MQREVLRKTYPGLPKEVRVVVAPVEADIPDQNLKTLYNRWILNRSAKNGLVSRKIIETAEFVPLLRNIMLLEIERPTPFEFDYIYRIYGAEIAERYGHDMTGKRTSDFPSPVAKLFLDLYEMSIDCRAPLYSEHAPPLNVDVVMWERLILPLGEDAVDWILAVNLPKGSRKKNEEAEAANSGGKASSDDQDVFYLD
jgi:hypothetical protein